jgi:hypothetical protein
MYSIWKQFNEGLNTGPGKKIYFILFFVLFNIFLVSAYMQNTRNGE